MLFRPAIPSDACCILLLQACYSIKVVSLCTHLQPSSDHVQYLQLVFYLLLVNTEDLFPCLVSPEVTASCHAIPPTAISEESDLNLKVREYRRKMGYGLLSTPSVASQLVLNEAKVEGQMHEVRTHLERVVQDALHHMRKDELWKRMLYGISHTNEGKAVS